ASPLCAAFWDAPPCAPRTACSPIRRTHLVSATKNRARIGQILPEPTRRRRALATAIGTACPLRTGRCPQPAAPIWAVKPPLCDRLGSPQRSWHARLLRAERARLIFQRLCCVMISSCVAFE